MDLAAQAEDDRPLYSKALLRLARNRRDFELAFSTRPQQRNRAQLVRHESRSPQRRREDRLPTRPRNANLRRLPPIETSRFY